MSKSDYIYLNKKTNTMLREAASDAHRSLSGHIDYLLSIDPAGMVGKSEPEPKLDIATPERGPQW